MFGLKRDDATGPEFGQLFQDQFEALPIRQGLADRQLQAALTALVAMCKRYKTGGGRIQLKQPGPVPIPRGPNHRKDFTGSCLPGRQRSDSRRSRSNLDPQLRRRLDELQETGGPPLFEHSRVKTCRPVLGEPGSRLRRQLRVIELGKIDHLLEMSDKFNGTGVAHDQD